MPTKKRKKDFEIKGRRTGNQLKGYENEYLYFVTYHGTQISPYGFSSKKKADTWLSRFIQYYNDHLDD